MKKRCNYAWWQMLTRLTVVAILQCTQILDLYVVHPKIIYYVNYTSIFKHLYWTFSDITSPPMNNFPLAALLHRLLSWLPPDLLASPPGSSHILPASCFQGLLPTGPVRGYKRLPLWGGAHLLTMGSVLSISLHSKSFNSRPDYSQAH